MKKESNRWWRSLSELESGSTTPKTPDYSGSSLNRREFLTLMGASLALAGFNGCMRRPVEKIIPYVTKPDDLVLGNPQYYATAMPFGLENFPLLAESHEGRPTYLKGNPQHPLSRGATHRWAIASILDLYDPDRSTQVVKDSSPSTFDEFLKNWEQWAGEHAANDGEGLVFLVPPMASPTAWRLRRALEQKFPGAQWVAYAPVHDGNIRRGLELVLGRAVEPWYDFTKARVVLALDADFLDTESHALSYARDFAEARRGEETNRLYLVEPVLTTTSTMADHRLALPASEVQAFAVALLQELQARGVKLNLPVPSVTGWLKANPKRKRFIKTLATDLVNHRGSSVVLAGRRQPPQVHALVAWINALLGNQGKTVKYYDHPYAWQPDDEAFTSLVKSMENGSVQTLVMMDVNPVFDAPSDLAFSQALSQVKRTIHWGLHRDETAIKATFHLPASHYLESWGDVSWWNGYVGVVQPLIRPLFKTSSLVQFLGALSAGKEQKDYDLVRETFQDFLPQIGFDKHWQKVVHDGFLPGEPQWYQTEISSDGLKSTLEQLVLRGNGEKAELIFQLSPQLYDGRFANNAWLQELPDPVTKLTWDNALLVSPKTARAWQVDSGKLVEVHFDKRKVSLPVWVLPGVADNTLVATLGYGRREGGNIFKSSGFDVYPLRTNSGKYVTQGVYLVALDKSYPLACVQDFHGLDTEKLAAKGVAERQRQIIREATWEEYRRNPEVIREAGEEAPEISMWKDWKYDTGYQWGMTIDLNACTGCNVCTIACQSENNIPVVGKKEVLKGREMHWIRVDRYFSGSPDDPEVAVQPVNCMHCEMAPCEQVCPVSATNHDHEGLNTMNYNRCVGTRYCANNCPYKVRRFNFYNYTKDIPEIVQMAMNPDVTVRFRGVMEKCTFCIQRIREGEIQAKRENRAVRDGEIMTACQEACPTGAITFGNINDKNSEVVKRKQEPRNYALLQELNLRPRTTYLARLRNPHPAMKQTT